MISFSKQTKDAWTTLSGTPANLVNDRIYFVEGVGTFIYTTENGIKKYDYDFSAADISGWVSGYVDGKYIPKVSGETGEIAKFTSDGTIESTNLTAGDSAKTNFGSDTKLAVESAVTGYVADQISDFVTDAGFAHKTTGTTSGTLFINNGSGDLSDATAKIGDSEKTGFGKSDEVAIESAVTGYVADQIAAIPKLSGENNGPVVIDVTAGNIVSGDLRFNSAELQVNASEQLEINMVPSGKVATLPYTKVEEDPTHAHKVNAADKDEVLVADANGDLSGSNFKIGLTTSAEFGNAAEIAVESAVKEYVDSKVETASSDAISGITFSNNDAQISYTKINGTASVPVVQTLSGLVSDASMDGKTLTLTTRGSTVPNITADIEGLVSSFTYDDGKITLGIKGGSLPPINLPAEQFLKNVKTYTVPVTGVTADVTGVFTQAIPADTFAGISGVPGIVFQFGTVDDPNDETNGEVEVYKYTFVSVQDLVHDYNEAQFKIDSTTGKLQAALSGAKGEVLQANSSTGLVEGSGKKVGSELSGALASPTANTLATEAAVNGWVTDLLSFK